jgi:hypothetical protein
MRQGWFDKRRRFAEPLHRFLTVTARLADFIPAHLSRMALLRRRVALLRHRPAGRRRLPIPRLYFFIAVLEASIQAGFALPFAALRRFGNFPWIHACSFVTKGLKPGTGSRPL